MIHLCYANQTEALLQALGERLAAARAQPGASLFQPTHLVVPNRNVETYVKLGVARALGVAANIQTRLLRGFLAEVVRANVPGGEVEVIDRLHIQGELLGLLQDERFCAARELAPVRDYLLAAGTAPDAVDLRRFQLSAQLAALFDDYPFSRPEMLHAWREGKLFEGPELTLQRWQRELWLGIFGRGGTLPTRERRDGRRRLTLAGLFDDPPAEPLRLPPAVHIFGISYVARLYKRIFAALAQATDLHIYTLNPCREFWEDLDTGARRPKTRSPADRRKFPPRRSPEQLALGAVAPGPGEAPVDENPLLTLWGRPGRDNIKLLNQLSDCDFEARFVDPIGEGAPLTVLRQLQHDILDRIPARTGAARLALADDSVTVFACPDPRRELETIAAEIWRLMRAAPGDGGAEPLRFNDVAVLVPGADAAARLSLASAVFREASELPHSVVDLPLPADSRIAEAIELLLGLPLGPMGRQDLLRLAMHPAVAGRFPGVDPSRWPALCEELEIVHGADHQDHAGTYIDRDVYNWDQGLRRLALGALLSGSRSGDDRIFAAPSGQYLAAELAPDAQADATRFTLLVRSLLAGARRARAARLTLPEWMTFLRGMITQAITPQGPDDQSALLRCLAELQPLEELGPPDLAVGYRVACELVRAALATLAARRGQYLADGVTVSSFLPMRAVPFKIIFIAGLGEGEFPAGERPTPLDLRTRAPRPGDVSPREADQYMFLEALLCARQRLYCSYVASDPLTGEAHAPSSVLMDLLGALRGGYWAAGAEAAATRRPPLRRHEDAQMRAVFPAAAREQQAVALGDDLKRRLPAGSGGAGPDLEEARRLLPAPIWREVSAALGWLAPPAAPAFSAGDAAPAAQTLSLSLSTVQLRRFLECPLQGSTGVLLRLNQGDDEVEAASREDEDFEPRPGAVDRLLRQVFQHALRTASADPAADVAALGLAYAAQVERQSLDGTLPLGAFGAAAQRRHQRTLSIWLEELRRLTGEQRPELGRVFFGHADEHEADPRILPAVTLEIPLPSGIGAGGAAGPPRTVRVSIHGRSEVLSERDGQRLILLLARNGQKAELPREQLTFVRAFIDHVVLSASDEAPPRASRALLCRRTPAKSAPSEITFQPLARDEARGYLRELIGELLSGVHPYLLPWEAIHSWRGKSPSPPVPDVVTMLRDDNWTRFQSDYGPLSRAHARSFPPPTDQEARAMIARRFGLFFDRRVKAAGAEPGGPAAEGE